MAREIDRKYGSGKITINKSNEVFDRQGQKSRKTSKYKYKMSSAPKRSVNTQYSGKPKASPKMPKARDMAVGNKNISYVGDPFIVDGKKFDPAKKFPETYMRPEGAKTFKTGGMCRGAGAAVKGKKFQGVF